MKRVFLSAVPAVLSAFWFAACGDDSAIEAYQPAMVESSEDLEACSDKIMGQMFFVKDSGAVFLCSGESWQKLDANSTVDTVVVKDTLVVYDTLYSKGLDGASCEVVAMEGGYKVLCGDDSVGVLLNGANGKDGVDGIDGKDGVDGVDGINGEDGVDGTNATCTLNDHHDGSIDVECGYDGNTTVVTIYKAYCGDRYFDPESQVCGEFGIFDICDSDKEGEMALSPEGNYYKCSAGSWVKATTLEFDTFGLECPEDASLISGAVVPANKYVCDKGSIRVATAMEKKTGKGCTSYNASEDRLIDYSYYICDATKGWTYNFKHLNTSTVSYSGQSYKVVGIGTQMWFAQNLNYADSSKTTNLKGNSWCYGNTKSNCTSMGRLYTWTAAMNLPSSYLTKRADLDGKVAAKHQGICPSGWHIPSHDDWQTLANFVTANKTSVGAGASLKSSGWKSMSGVSVTNEFGFNGAPAGNRNDAGSFTGSTDVLDMISTNEINTATNYFWRLYYDNNSFYERYYNSKSFGRPVRCVKN